MKDSGLFNTSPYLVSFLYDYRKMKTDIANGLKNATLKKIAPNIDTKKNSLTDASLKILTATNSYNSIALATNKIKRVIQQVRNGETVVWIKPDMEKYTNIIDFHNSHLPEIIQSLDNAERTILKNSLTKEDEFLLANISKHAEKIISRNVNRFNQKINNVHLEPKAEKQLTEKLEKQRQAIELLWNTIEENKKLFFNNDI